MIQAKKLLFGGFKNEVSRLGLTGLPNAGTEDIDTDGTNILVTSTDTSVSQGGGIYSVDFTTGVCTRVYGPPNDGMQYIFGGITYGNGRWVASALRRSLSNINDFESISLTSTNITTWTAAVLSTSDRSSGLVKYVSGATRFIHAGATRTAYSTNGTTWTGSTANTVALASVGAAGSVGLFGLQSGNIRSLSGTTYTNRTTGLSTSEISVPVLMAFGNAVYLAATNDLMRRSTNLSTWTTVANPTIKGKQIIGYAAISFNPGNNLFYVDAFSSDYIVWTFTTSNGVDFQLLEGNYNAAVLNTFSYRDIYFQGHRINGAPNRPAAFYIREVT